MNKADLLIQQPEFTFLNKLPAEPLYYWNYVLANGG